MIFIRFHDFRIWFITTVSVMSTHETELSPKAKYVFFGDLLMSLVIEMFFCSGSGSA